MKSNSPPAGKGPHRDLAKEQSWRKFLKQFAASGQSVREFCTTHQLKEPSFYAWRREIQHRDGRASAPSQCATPHPVAFAKVLVQPPVREDAPRLRLGNERELLLPASWTAEQLAALVRAIEDAA